MEFLKELFGGNSLSYEQFEKAVNDKKMKLVNLSDGGYVDKKKYDDDITAKDNSIAELNNTIGSRDKDIADIKKQLEEAGADKDKLSTVTSQLSELQTKYETDSKAYQEKLSKQEYEFAVKDFANGQKFSSNAAKRDFINSMINKGLKMEKDHILGADDFVKAYAENNADAFVVEKPQEPEKPAAPVPQFGASVGAGGSENANPFTFHFAGVRQPRKE